jgi:hypothetical protein
LGINQLNRDVIAAAEIMAPACKASREMRNILASDIDNYERGQWRKTKETRQKQHAGLRSKTPEEEYDFGDKVALLPTTRSSDEIAKGPRDGKGRAMGLGAYRVQGGTREKRRKPRIVTCRHKLLKWLSCDRNII